MKKTLSLALVLVLCFSLCACNTNEGVTTDGNETTVANVISEEEMQSTFEDYALVLTLTNTKCDTVNALIHQIWYNHGTDDFYTYFNAVLDAGDPSTSDDTINDYYSWYLTYWAAGEALYPDKYGTSMTSEEKREVKEECATFVAMYNSLLESDGLTDYIAEFAELYGEDYPKQTELLQEWSLETKLYIDFSTTPSGTLLSYTNQRSEFKAKLDRYQAEAEMYK